MPQAARYNYAGWEAARHRQKNIAKKNTNKEDPQKKYRFGGWYCETSLSPLVFLLLTVPRRCYSGDFGNLYNHSIHHSLTTHLHSGTMAVPVRSLSGSIIGMIGMISVIPFHSLRTIAELQKKSLNSEEFYPS